MAVWAVLHLEARGRLQESVLYSHHGFWEPNSRASAFTYSHVGFFLVDFLRFIFNYVCKSVDALGDQAHRISPKQKLTAGCL